MDLAARRRGSVQAGAAAGLAGLAVFLVLHHAWIAPIWFVAPVGATVAAGCGALVGAAYAELLPHLPPRPWTAAGVLGIVVTMLAPSIVLAELRGPVYHLGPDGGGTLLVPVPAVLTAFVVGLLGTAALTGAAVGKLIGHTRKAATTTAIAGLALALGPGHNIPLIGGTPATAKELTILALVAAVAAVVLVELQALIRGRSGSSIHALRVGTDEPGHESRARPSVRATSPPGDGAWGGPDPMVEFAPLPSRRGRIEA